MDVSTTNGSNPGSPSVNFDNTKTLWFLPETRIDGTRG
ncbi:predicted protein [Botrytis cinerea T4]|uniref:Uncharacterized protein n=1 Tax=Botryotinia fuckeliana (strain T4) TaxID=999810 RepID=G2Y0Z2_BOTF4|nr:predicted protein [Botrytis cinerea T4]